VAVLYVERRIGGLSNYMALDARGALKFQKILPWWTKSLKCPVWSLFTLLREVVDRDDFVGPSARVDASFRKIVVTLNVLYG